MATTTFKVNNMDCASCAMVIESDLDDAGIKAKCNYAKETLEIEHTGKLNEKKIFEVVSLLGYTLASTK